jgi:hypothetical protein
MSRSRTPARLVLPVALVMSFAATACGGAAATPKASDPVNATASPSVVPTPAGEALTETLTATVGGRTVKYPSGWLATENLGTLYVITSQAANDRLIARGSLDPGDVFIQFAQNTILSGATSDPAEHLPAYLTVLSAGMGFTVPTPVAMTSVGRQGARIDVQTDKLALIVISLKVRDDLFADVIAYVPVGEQAAREQLILAIVDSLTYPAA